MGTKNGLFPQVTPNVFFYYFVFTRTKDTHTGLGTTLEHLNKTGVIMQIGSYLEKL